MSEIGTHWDGCWRHHHPCAVALIERLIEIARQDGRRWAELEASMQAAIDDLDRGRG